MEKDYHILLLEEIRDQNKTLLEGQKDQASSADVRRLQQDVTELKQDMKVVRAATTDTSHQCMILSGVSRGLKRPRICGLYGPCKLNPVYADTGHFSLSVARCYNGLCSPRPQYSTNSSCFNYSLSWLILKLNKAISGLLLDERISVYRSIVARCGAVGGGVLLLKLV